MRILLIACLLATSAYGQIGNCTNAHNGSYTITVADVGCKVTSSATGTYTMPKAGSVGFEFRKAVVLMNIAADGSGVILTVQVQSGVIIGYPFSGSSVALLSPGQAILLSSTAPDWQLLSYDLAGSNASGVSIPAPTSTTLGGVKSLTCSAGQHLSDIDNTGTPHCTVDTGTGGGANYATGGGTAQAQTATYSPAIVLTDGVQACWLPAASNTATAPTFAPNGLTAHTIVKVPNATALVANDIRTTSPSCAIYNLTATRWELQNPQTAVTGATIPPVVNLINGDGAGSGSDSGIPPATVVKGAANISIAGCITYRISAGTLTCTASLTWDGTALNVPGVITGTSGSNANAYGMQGGTVTLTGLLTNSVGFMAPASVSGQHFVVEPATGSPANNSVKVAAIEASGLSTYSWFTLPAALISGFVDATSSVQTQLNNAKSRRLASFVFDGGGTALSSTMDACVDVDVASTITNVVLLADASGSGVVDVRTVAYASYTGPASASTITASAVPTLSSAVKYTDTTLTGWTTAVAAKTVVCFHLTSPATSTWIEVSLNGKVN